MMIILVIIITPIKEFSLHKVLCPQLLQADSHHVDAIGVHGGLQEAQLNGPQATQLSSKPSHEVDNSGFLRPE